MKEPDSQVVALCEVDRWRLQVDSRPRPDAAKQNGFTLDALKGCFRTTDFREVLARKDVDAVITTPDHWHVPIALGGGQGGQGRVLRKPIGLCIAAGRMLADAVAKSKCVFRTDSEFRSKPEFFKAVGLVRAGRSATQDDSLRGPGLRSDVPRRCPCSRRCRSHGIGL